MARNGSGFFNKFLNVIGLVDEPQDQGYGDKFDRAPASTARQTNTYVPRQQNSRTADTRRRTVVQQERPSSRYNVNSRYEQDPNEGFTVRRSANLDEEFDSAARAERRQPTARRENAEPVRRDQAPTTRPQQSMGQQRGPARTVMYNITSLEQCSEVVDALISNNIVFLNMGQLDDHMAQRAVDTLSGAAFALKATIRKAADRTYLIAPRNVEVNSNGFSNYRGQ